MKRFLSFTLVFIVMILFIYCIIPKRNVDRRDSVELILIYDEQNIQITLPDDEAHQIRRIMDGNLYDSGTPACGFTENCSLKIGGTFYAVATDSCNTIMDCTAERYFTVTQEEMDYIHSLFQKYDK